MKELEKLKAASGRIVQKLTEESYNEGLDELVGELQEQGVPMDEITGTASSAASSAAMVPMSEKPAAQLAMSRLNKSQIRIVAENTNYDFNRTIDLIGRRIDDSIREAAIEATAEKLTEGQTVHQMQKNVEQKLTSQNLTAVEYSNGSQMPIKSYAEMVSRSTTAEAQNVAKTTQGKAMGYDLVKMTTHSPTCPICAQYQGRVYAITKEAAEGKYKLDGVPLRFPYLYDTAFAGGYSTIHPNCRHRIAVFAIRAYTDEEIKRYVSVSNAPFEDTRSDQERKAYSAMVAKRRKLLENRRQYEKIKAALPDQAPKSFAAFVRMKAANSERYQNLMEDYRYVQKQINKEGKAVDNSKKGDIIELNRRVSRKNINTGAFKNLQIPMQKRSVLSVCRKYNIDVRGITFKIQRTESLLSTELFGSTDYDNIGRIDLFPNAFSDEEQLIRTILHEKCHVMQLRKHGKRYTQDHLSKMERQAYRFESVFYYYVRRRRST